MVTKLSLLKAAYARGDKIEALRIAAKFQQLGDAKEAITRAWAAHQNPDIYTDMGESPQELIEAGLAAIARRYGL